jgi:hypothetical protein
LRVSTRYPQFVADNACPKFDSAIALPIFAASCSRQGCSSRGIAWAERDRRPAGCLASSTREAPGKTRPSATRSGTREFANVKRACFTPGGLGANNRRGGAPRGERSAWTFRTCLRWTRGVARKRVHARLRCAMAPAGLRYWPAQGCRCTRAPVGAPLPCMVRGTVPQTSEDKCLARRMMLGRMRCKAVAFRTHQQNAASS